MSESRRRCCAEAERLTWMGMCNLCTLVECERRLKEKEKEENGNQRSDGRLL